MLTSVANAASNLAPRNLYLCLTSAGITGEPPCLLGVYMLAKDLNMDPHTCMAHALPTELSL